MKLLTWIFSLLICVLSSSNFDQINEYFHHFNDDLHNTSSIFMEIFDKYCTKLIQAMKKVSIIKDDMNHDVNKLKFKEFSFLLSLALERFKQINFPYFDDLNSCDDLKLLNATTFLSENMFSHSFFDEEIGNVAIKDLSCKFKFFIFQAGKVLRKFIKQSNSHMKATKLLLMKVLKILVNYLMQKK